MSCGWSLIFAPNLKQKCQGHVYPFIIRHTKKNVLILVRVYFIFIDTSEKFNLMKRALDTASPFKKNIY